MNSPIPLRSDFVLENHGSIFLLHALNEAAVNWVSGHLSDSGYQPYFPKAVVIGHRYISDIVLGIRNDELVVA